MDPKDNRRVAPTEAEQEMVPNSRNGSGEGKGVGEMRICHSPAVNVEDEPYPLTRIVVKGAPAMVN